MAFTTVTGASGAPTTYTGTDGVDLLTLVNPGASLVDALGANDTVNINLTTTTTTATGVTIRGGQGNDTFNNTGSVTGANFLISSFIAGNLGNDAMFTTGTGAIANASTIQGGQGNDFINVAFANGGTLINGNLGVDTINVGTAVAAPGGLSTISATSIFGGQGNDVMNVGGATTAVNLSGVSVDGADGDDNITIAALTSAAATTFTGGAGNDTINAATAGISVSLLGGDGNDNITGSGVADFIDGGAGQDLFTGGGGGDTIAGGAGNDNFIIAAATDTRNALLGSTTGTVSVISTNTNATTNSADIITSFTIGDQLTIAASYTSVGAAANTNTLVAVASSAGFSASNAVSFLRGTYNSSTNQFTFSATGSDTWIGADVDPSVAGAANVQTAGVVIQGVAVRTLGVGIDSAGDVVVTYLT